MVEGNGSDQGFELGGCWYSPFGAERLPDGSIRVPAGGVTATRVWDGAVVFAPGNEYYPIWQELLEDRGAWEGRHLSDKELDALYRDSRSDPLQP